MEILRSIGQFLRLHVNIEKKPVIKHSDVTSKMNQIWDEYHQGKISKDVAFKRCEQSRKDFFNYYTIKNQDI